MVDRTLHEDADPRTRVGDRYVLLGELGRGGMASVHRAHDEVLDRPVAVKLLHPHLARDPAFLERFRREARAAAALSHPNVVGVHDWGETDDGAYLVLQLVEGVTLREVLRERGHLEPAEALAVLGPAAAGLAAAHASGLVHRDVKPENLLLGRDGTVRVTDFGLARAAASATSTFGADVLVGSPHYLSPEAVDGLQLDARADVYALGIVLYECLVGEPPHEGDTPFTTALQHTAIAVPPPSQRRPEIPEAVDDAVLLATAIDREERLPDAAAFGRVLRAAVPEGPAPLLDLHASEVAATDDGPPDPGTRRLVGANHTAALFDDADHATALVQQGADRTAVVGVAGEDVSSWEVPVTSPDLPAPTPERRRRGWLVLVLLTLLIGGSAVGGYLVWDRVLAPMIPVPGVLGAAEDAAVAQLTEAGFEVAIDPERPHDRVTPAGHVLEQEPTEQARSGSTVRLVLSAGPVQVRIGEVEGLPRAPAVELLEESGLEVTVTERHDEEVVRGTVVSSAPRPGTVVDEGSVVELVVSLGPAPIEVPSLVGESEAAAQTQLERLGLGVRVTDRPFDARPAGTVLTQNPAPGETLYRGDEVTVTVSQGPEQVSVPNVRGLRVAEAVAELQARGFVVEIERQGGVASFFRPDRVFDQDPAPDSVRDAGSTVVLYAYEP